MSTVTRQSAKGLKIEITGGIGSYIGISFLLIAFLIGPWMPWAPSIQNGFNQLFNLQSSSEKFYKNEYGETVRETDTATIQRIPGEGLVIKFKK